MVRVLIVAVAVACCRVAAAEGDGRHEWSVDLTLGARAGSSDAGAWTDGDLGKLRFADGTRLGTTRLSAEYRGRLAPTVWARLAADYVDDASPGIDATEAFLEWRPLPKSPLRQQWRLGAFHPPLSLENGARGWESPYTPSFSAVSTWLGEEVRPVGLEGAFRRRLGAAGAAHEVGAFAGGFYGNDPAGTLLFWRGFAVHDRQSRLGDELPLAPAPVFDRNGVVVGHEPQTLRPFAEIDHRPGFYGGVEWRYARRAWLKLAAWDNRADPEAFASGQWGWRTRFSVATAQLDLFGAGLVAARLSGDTRWLIATTPTGQWTPATELVHDEFDASFLLLTTVFRDVHRVTLRYDDFDYRRPPDEVIDAGHAWTLGYGHDAGGRVAVSLEGLLIDSRRDLWTEFYYAPRRQLERQLRLDVTLRLRP
jgi:hypothetical protein